MLKQPLFYWLPKHPAFLIHPYPLHSQLRHLWLSTPHYTSPMLLTRCHFTPDVTRYFSTSLNALQDAMPRQRSLTLIPRGPKDFPRGDKHFKHVLPPL